ncbi:MAG: hypothetical protein GY906_27270 [bacterium]|nr:hypothetical protein [bacterium]
MPLSFSYDRERMVLSTKADGIVTLEEMLDYLHVVIADEHIKPGFVELVDFSAIEDFVVSFNDTRPFEDLWKSYVEKGCAATIVYAPGDLSFGVVRMVQTVIQTSGHGDQGVFVVVRTQVEVAEKLAQLRSDV